MDDNTNIYMEHNENVEINTETNFTDCFISLDQLYENIKVDKISKANDEINEEVCAEIKYIDNVLDKLQITMNKYMNNSYYIWTHTIIPFINSTDCLTLDNLLETDHHKFLNFMAGQNTYKRMTISYKRLQNRKKYLQNLI